MTDEQKRSASGASLFSVGLCVIILRSVRRIYNRVRFGKVTQRVVGTVADGVAAEIEYLDRKGRVVGFWAYGYWEPNSPYKE